MSETPSARPAAPNVFETVPMNSEDSWRQVKKIAWAAIYACGHPRGGCSEHCDLFAKIFDIACDRLKAEGVSR